MLSSLCCHRLVLQEDPSYLLDVAGLSKIVRLGFCCPGAGLAHVIVESQVMLIVVGRKVPLFFINSLSYEMFHRKPKVAKDPPLSKVK
jgi:hypothetical protein